MRQRTHFTFVLEALLFPLLAACSSGSNPERSEGSEVSDPIDGSVLYGHLLIPGLSDGEHIFEVEPSSRRGVRLVHRQIFKGLLVPILWPLMGAKTRSGFIRMNEALKEQSEKVQAASTLEQ